MTLRLDLLDEFMKGRCPVSLKVKDLMSSDVIFSRPQYDLGTICDLMLGNEIHHMPVVSPEKELLGLITYRDLLRFSLSATEDQNTLPAPEDLEKVRVQDVMFEKPLTCEPETELAAAARILCKTSYGCLPVLEDGRLVGILTETDFVHFMAFGLEADTTG